MPLMRPVLRDDPLAGPAWNACVALLALEKLQLGEELTEEEWGSIGKVADFLDLLLSTREDSILSEETIRLRIRKMGSLDYRLSAGRLRSLSVERKDSEVCGYIGVIQDAVLQILRALNLFRSR